ncbi:hypothetical protein ACFL2R_01395 [Patescibacteria group bacterium]
MEIIKKGRKQKGWRKEFTCTGKGNGGYGCEAVLLLSKDDVYLTHSYHYDSSHEVYRTFMCPCCQTETDIKETLPFRVEQEKNDYLKKTK